MKILIAPDAFKGTLTAAQAARAMADGIRDARGEVKCVLLPMADGGEGTMDVLAPHLGGRREHFSVRGVDTRPLNADALLFADHDGKQAILIETALIIGLARPEMHRIPVLQRSTCGVGDLIRRGLDRGVRRFYVALGGSGTNDGGIGMLLALGMRMPDTGDSPLRPGLSVTMDSGPDISGLDPRLEYADVHALVDVDNPLLGPYGASRTFGLQKGLKEVELSLVEESMRRWSELAQEVFGRRPAQHSGAGAAGGLGFGLMLLGAQPTFGARYVASVNGLEHRMKGCDRVITGEGKSDAQSLHGKAPCIVAELAGKARLPCTLMSGVVEDSSGFSGMFDTIVHVSPDGRQPPGRLEAARQLRRAAMQYAAAL